MNKLFKALFICVWIVGCSSEDTQPEPEKPIGEFIDDWTYSIFPEAPYSNFDIAEFRLWVPQENTDLKAVLVLLTSSNGSALGLANSKDWQAYAEKERLAVCSVNLKSLENGGNYAQAGSGSGQALIDAIDQIATKHAISQISKLPYLMRGYSAGGNFSYSFSSFMPEKVVGLVSIRGGQLETTTKNVTVPGLVLTGELEGDQRNEYLKGIALEKRNEGGLWSFAIEPNATHFNDLIASDELIKVFFSSILKKRISENPEELNSIPEDSGWLGNNTRTDIYAYSDYPGNKTSAFWLVDEEFAEAWLNYQKLF